MSRPTRKPTLWTLRKISTWISLSMPWRLTRTDTFRLLWIFCFMNHYSIPLSPWDGMYRPGLAWADCAGWSWSIHYAESIMLVFLWNSSYIHVLPVVPSMSRCSNMKFLKVVVNRKYSWKERNIILNDFNCACSFISIFNPLPHSYRVWRPSSRWLLKTLWLTIIEIAQSWWAISPFATVFATIFNNTFISINFFIFWLRWF